MAFGKIFKPYILDIYHSIMSLKKETKNSKSSVNNSAGKEILIRFEGSEIIERQVSSFGTGCHVIVPKEYTGKKVKIIFEDK